MGQCTTAPKDPVQGAPFFVAQKQSPSRLRITSEGKGTPPAAPHGFCCLMHVNATLDLMRSTWSLVLVQRQCISVFHFLSKRRKYFELDFFDDQVFGGIKHFNLSGIQEEQVPTVTTSVTTVPS